MLRSAAATESDCKFTMINNDFQIMAGEFFEFVLQKNKQYLYKYFKTDVQKVFLHYFVLFGNYTRFVEHSGYFVTRRYLRRLKNKFLRLEVMYEKAKASGDIEMVSKLESGKLKIKNISQ